ncbi:glycogen debranching N-terminal domain-containing protein [Streptomyces sp. NBC_01171]|uniref:glycogen debranching N-terminal domain-containing protein n=1 Tax=Streptomyces sp. NBC_01171 TaxID=2903757 RepID=UPI0038685671|nr:hypothetical protein OG448_02350 [Streptomyces sp. NBC_01171]
MTDKVGAVIEETEPEAGVPGAGDVRIISDRQLRVERRRPVGEGMREDLRLRNLSTRPMTVPVTLPMDGDPATA